MNARVKVTSTAAITGCVLAALAGIAAAPAAAAPSRLRAAARAYHAAYDDLARQAHLAA